MELRPTLANLRASAYAFNPTQLLRVVIVVAIKNYTCAIGLVRSTVA